MTLVMTTAVNGVTVESHEVTDTEAWLWKSVLGKDLRAIADSKTLTTAEKAKAADSNPILDTEPTPNDLLFHSRTGKFRTREQAEQAGEREALVRVIHAVEAATNKLPRSARHIAAQLFGNGIKGNDTPTGNPLANYYRQAALDALNGASLPPFDPKNLTIHVTASGTIVETPRYQLCIDPHGAQASFLEGHSAGLFRELWAY